MTAAFLITQEMQNPPEKYEYGKPTGDEFHIHPFGRFAKLLQFLVAFVEQPANVAASHRDNCCYIHKERGQGSSFRLSCAEIKLTIKLEHHNNNNNFNILQL